MYVVIDDNAKRAKKVVDILKTSEKAGNGNVYSCGDLTAVRKIVQVACDQDEKNVTFIVGTDMEVMDICEILLHIKKAMGQSSIQLEVVATGPDNSKSQEAFDAGASWFIQRQHLASYYRPA